jgi:hypothetical protein
MARHLTFSQYLIGQTSLERPCFFYAYSVMWFHLFIGTILLFFFAGFSLLQILPSLVIGSFSLGIVIYSVLAREYPLLVNLASYTLSMIQALSPEILGLVFSLIAIIIALVSGHFLLSSEYRHYSREISNNGDDEGGILLGLTVATGITVILICFYGLSLL